jgi:hypothetical protein
MSLTALSHTLFLYVVFGQGANGTLFLALLLNLGFQQNLVREIFVKRKQNEARNKETIFQNVLF